MIVLSYPSLDEDLGLPQQANDLFRGISLSGHGLASICFHPNPNLRLGPVFGARSYIF